MIRRNLHATLITWKVDAFLCISSATDGVTPFLTKFGLSVLSVRVATSNKA
ncbi:hypothetical protein N9248_01930 [bacterium]|nr:hypothetical protein [bacterium]